MAAGLGFKTFAVGEVLSAANVNGYLMQGVLVFADAAARDAAITSPQEGQFAYLKDTNVTTYYTGSAWANLDTTGMTNPMTTTGDTIYSSSGSTPARLGIGSTGQVLTVSGGVPSWATPASGGGMTLLSTTNIAGGAATTISSISQDYNHLYVEVNGFQDGGDGVGFKINSSVNATTVILNGFANNAAQYQYSENNTLLKITVNAPQATASKNFGWAYFYNYTNTSQMKYALAGSIYTQSSGVLQGNRNGGFFDVTAAITSLVYDGASSRPSANGTIKIYGIK
jgi:hypothetical protein